MLGGALGVIGQGGDGLVDFVTHGVTQSQRDAIGELPRELQIPRPGIVEEALVRRPGVFRVVHRADRRRVALLRAGAGETQRFERDPDFHGVPRARQAPLRVEGEAVRAHELTGLCALAAELLDEFPVARVPDEPVAVLPAKDEVRQEEVYACIVPAPGAVSRRRASSA